MEREINLFCEILYQRDIIKKQQLLAEGLRVLLVKEVLKKQKIAPEDMLNNPDGLYLEMKKLDGKSLGYFPGDRELFLRLFELARHFEISEFITVLYTNDRTGTVFVPGVLTDNLLGRLQKPGIRSVLIAEAEKLWDGLKQVIDSHMDKLFTLTTENSLMQNALKMLFEDYANVEIVYVTIYRRVPDSRIYDFVYTVPSFGVQFGPDDLNDDFLTREAESIAVENLLNWVAEKGVLQVVLPAKVTFTSGSMARFREFVRSKYHLSRLYGLPEGIFRPYTSIKTYLTEICREYRDSIQIGEYCFQDDRLATGSEQEILRTEFDQYEDWRIELFLASDKEEILLYKSSPYKKVKLKDLAEIFRGKSIMKDDLKPGQYAILNISNIENDGINFSTMETLDEEERKLKRYELAPGDLVLTSRGTVNKVAVFPETDRKVIASANIIVLRFKEPGVSEYIKIFLESPLGTTLIQSFQRGSVVMNINHKDIGELEVPLPPVSVQRKLVQQYHVEHERYITAVTDATRRWEEQRKSIYTNILS